MDVTEVDVRRAMDHAEKEAWNALARYKYWMFGYWAGEWVKLKNLAGLNPASPFAELVKLARSKGFGPDAGSVESMEVAHADLVTPTLLAVMMPGLATLEQANG